MIVFLKTIYTVSGRHIRLILLLIISKIGTKNIKKNKRFFLSGISKTATMKFCAMNILLKLLTQYVRMKMIENMFLALLTKNRLL